MLISGSLIRWRHVQLKELGSFGRITLIFVLNYLNCPSLDKRDLRRIYQTESVTCISLLGNNVLGGQETPAVRPDTVNNAQDPQLRHCRRLQPRW